MGITGGGKFDILHIRRYHGMGYDDIAGDILHNHKVYHGTAMASDFGVGAVYNSKLREKIPPQRHLVFGYVGPNSALISEPRQAHMYNQWSLNKTESISFTFEAIRSQRIRCFAWTVTLRIPTPHWAGLKTRAGSWLTPTTSAKSSWAARTARQKWCPILWTRW